MVHFGHRPAQLYYAGNSDYQRAWREFVKFRHLLANMAKPSYNDKRKLEIMAKDLVKYRWGNVKDSLLLVAGLEALTKKLR